MKHFGKFTLIEVTVLITMLLTALGIILYCCFMYTQSNIKWNNGICPNCNSHYVLKNAQDKRYYWVCENCQNTAVTYRWEF